MTSSDSSSAPLSGRTATVLHGRFAGRRGTVVDQDGETGAVTMRIAFGSRTAVVVLHSYDLR